MPGRDERDTLLIVFAKSPEPGRVKSRLWPVLGKAGAARLQARLTLRALATARAADCADVELCGAPVRSHPFFVRAAAGSGAALHAQGRGDLGLRMRRALERGLRRYPRAMLMGSDCPSLTPGRLRAAARALRGGCDAVFAPAVDGGYALVGLSRASPRLFDGIDWGTPRVMEQTRQRLRMLGWRWRELPPVWDIDRPEDYARLLRSGLLDRAP